MCIRASGTRPGGLEPYRLSVRQLTCRFLYFVPRRDIVQRPAQGPLLELAHNARIKGQRLGDKLFMKPPHPPLPDEGINPQQLIILVLDIVPVKRPLPFTSIPVRCL